MGPVPIQPYRGGVVDTEQVKATVRRLTDALYDYLTLDVTALERAAAMPMPQVPVYPPPSPERLIEVQEQLDMMRARLEEGEAALSDMPESMASMFRVGVLGMLQDSIKAQESYLSKLQAELEIADA